MAGLLEGLAVFGSGMAGAAKMAGDTFSEQLKQDALAARETNMARINSLYAKEAQKSGQEFTAGENKLTREATAAENEKLRDVTINEAGKSRLQARTLAEEADFAAGARQDRASEQAIALADKEIQARIDLYKEQKRDATTLVRLQHQLSQSAPGPLAKTITDLAPFVGKEQAVKLAIDSFSGDKDKRKLYGEVITQGLKTLTINGETMTPEKEATLKELAASTSGWSPEPAAKAGAAPVTNYLDRAIQKAAGKPKGNTASTAPPTFDSSKMAWNPTQGSGLLEGDSTGQPENPLLRSIVSDQMNKLKEYKPRR